MYADMDGLFADFVANGVPIYLLNEILFPQINEKSIYVYRHFYTKSGKNCILISLVLMEIGPETCFGQS